MGDVGELFFFLLFFCTYPIFCNKYVVFVIKKIIEI